MESEENGIIVNHSLSRLYIEEDPWSNYGEISNIEYSNTNSEILGNTFNINEWESEEDESNSSEEFMYVKGSSVNGKWLLANHLNSKIK